MREKKHEPEPYFDVEVKTRGLLAIKRWPGNGNGTWVKRPSLVLQTSRELVKVSSEVVF